MRRRMVWPFYAGHGGWFACRGILNMVKQDFKPNRRRNDIARDNIIIDLMMLLFAGIICGLIFYAFFYL